MAHEEETWMRPRWWWRWGRDMNRATKQACMKRTRVEKDVKRQTVGEKKGWSTERTSKRGNKRTDRVEVEEEKGAERKEETVGLRKQERLEKLKTGGTNWAAAWDVRRTAIYKISIWTTTPDSAVARWSAELTNAIGATNTENGRHQQIENERNRTVQTWDFECEWLDHRHSLESCLVWGCDTEVAFIEFWRCILKVSDQNLNVAIPTRQNPLNIFPNSDMQMPRLHEPTSWYDSFGSYRKLAVFVLYDQANMHNIRKMVEAEEKETILVSMMVTALTTALPVIRRLFGGRSTEEVCKLVYCGMLMLCDKGKTQGTKEYGVKYSPAFRVKNDKVDDDVKVKFLHWMTGGISENSAMVYWRSAIWQLKVILAFHFWVEEGASAKYDI